MQCEEAELVMSTLFDNECENLRVREMLEHLVRCRNCRKFLAQMFLLRAMCRVARGQWGRAIVRLGK